MKSHVCPGLLVLSLLALSLPHACLSVGPGPFLPPPKPAAGKIANLGVKHRRAIWAAGIMKPLLEAMCPAVRA